jgi:anti-sigma regulatory factor (Ser/Thr protein kinase)
MCWEGRRTFDCNPSAAKSGREFCSQHLRAVIDTPEANRYVDDAELVTSELLTNAVNAGCADTRLLINLHHDHVRIGVRDNAQGSPHMDDPTPEQSHGRGLRIVDHLAADWGVRGAGAGKEVWANIAIPTNLTAGIHCDLAER